MLDRLVQQAILQVLQPILDPTFSASSFGFRPRRGAHDALRQAGAYVAQGRAIVVDLDLENPGLNPGHDMVMARLARRIGDKRLLRIVRRFLEAGLMQDGVCLTRHEGTPQGGPLSPPSYHWGSPIFCSTTSTRNWRSAATVSAVEPVLGPAEGRTRGPTT